jgi:hypothetical protein
VKKASPRCQVPQVRQLVVSHTYGAQRRSWLRSSEVVEVDLLDLNPDSAPVYRVELFPPCAILRGTAQSRKREREKKYPNLLYI